MAYLSDPNKVHEILVILILIIMFPTAFVAMAYIKVLGAFFKELKEKEPAIWQAAGSPDLAGMMVLPFRRFKKYYAFFPALQERAARKNGDYKYAWLAYMLLGTGLAMTAILFALVGITIFWIVYNGL